MAFDPPDAETVVTWIRHLRTVKGPATFINRGLAKTSTDRSIRHGLSASRSQRVMG